MRGQTRRTQKKIEEAEAACGPDQAGIAYIDGLLRYHLHLDPDQLNDDEWAMSWAVLKDIRNREAGKK